MKRFMHKSLQALALVVLVGGAAGCLTRTIVDGNSGPMDSMLLETLDRRAYWIGEKYTNQFWECKDTGEKLICTPSCGSLHDVPCPFYGTGAFEGQSG